MIKTCNGYLASSEHKKGSTTSKSIVPISAIVVLLLSVFIFYQVGEKPQEVDEKLCPISGPISTTVFLLDTSDPLTPKHNETVRKIIRDSVNQQGKLALIPESRIVVYELSGSANGIPNELLNICRPLKSLEDRTWKDDIHQGRMYAQRAWNQFEQSITSAFPDGEQESAPISPLLETIGVIAARHIPGKMVTNTRPVNLVIFSDLLQHTDRLSHYGPYSEVDQFRELYPDLRADLYGATVSIFRLERAKYRQWQTTNHYYWWTEWVGEMGGQIVWQDQI